MRALSADRQQKYGVLLSRGELGSVLGNVNFAVTLKILVHGGRGATRRGSELADGKKRREKLGGTASGWSLLKP